MKIQQHENKRRGWVEGSVYNVYRLFWANSNVLWNDKFTSYISDNDEWNPERSDKQRESHSICKWHTGRNEDRERTQWNYKGNIKEARGE